MERALIWRLLCVMFNNWHVAASGRFWGEGRLKALRSTLAACSLMLAVCFVTGPASAEKGISQAALPAPASSLPDDDRAALDAESAQSPAASTAVAPGDASLASIRIGDRGAETRFVIELGGPQPVNYRVFTLADPYRVIVDFPKLQSSLPADAEKKGRGVIAGYRLGRFQDDRFRVVIDATGPVSVARNFVLEPQGGFGRRIVIDLGATDRASFLKTAEKPDDGGVAVTANPGSVLPAPSAGSGSSAATGPQASASVVVPASPPARRDRRRIIVIDPGHGGVDPGTHGTRSGIVEKNVVLAFAKELAKRLRATGRYEVHLTRDRDIFIPLRERVQIGRRYKADLFISIHADSISKSDVKGMSVYTLSEKASDKEAAELARKENLSDAIAGIDFKGESPEVTGILIDLAQRETKNYSVRFAKSVVDYAGKATYLLEPTHRFAGFVVLKAPDVPSVLVELGFLTNPVEEKRLTSPKWRTSVSNAFVHAVDRYFGERLAEGPN